jgi:hypothetical protein
VRNSEVEYERKARIPNPLLLTYYSLLITPYLLFLTHYSLLITPYSLLTINCAIAQNVNSRFVTIVTIVTILALQKYLWYYFNSVKFSRVSVRELYE